MSKKTEKAEIEAVVAEWREKHPQLFSHPECKPDEVWRGNFHRHTINAAFMVFANRGVRNVRIGQTAIVTEFESFAGGEKITAVSTLRPLFVNVYDLAAAEKRYMHDCAKG